MDRISEYLIEKPSEGVACRARYHRSNIIIRILFIYTTLSDVRLKLAPSAMILSGSASRTL